MILKYNGAQIADAGQLSVQVSGDAPGDKATLEVMRDGKLMTITATVGSASAATVAANGEAAPEATHLGMTLRPLTQSERDQAGVPGGLVVEAATGRAAEAGIRQGDVVLAVDGTPVRSVEQLRKLVHDHDSQVALLIQRGDSRIFVPVGLGVLSAAGAHSGCAPAAKQSARESAIKVPMKRHPPGRSVSRRSVLGLGGAQCG